jgi:hypothetical protein
MFDSLTEEEKLEFIIVYIPRSSSSKRHLAAATAYHLVADGDWQFSFAG